MGPFRYSMFLWLVRCRSMKTRMILVSRVLSIDPYYSCCVAVWSMIYMFSRLSSGILIWKAFLPPDHVWTFFLKANVVWWIDWNSGQHWYSFFEQVGWALLFRFVSYWLWRWRNAALLVEDFFLHSLF